MSSVYGKFWTLCKTPKHTLSSSADSKEHDSAHSNGEREGVKLKCT